jgi:hypothetical protein
MYSIGTVFDETTYMFSPKYWTEPMLLNLELLTTKSILLENWNQELKKFRRKGMNMAENFEISLKIVL